MRLAGVILMLLISSTVRAQTCNAYIPGSAPVSRYTDNGDSTVTDSATGLMWKQCPEGLSGAGCAFGSAAAYTWDKALQRADAVNLGGGFAGYTDWRVPNQKELLSLLETKCYRPAINAALFPRTPISKLVLVSLAVCL